MRYEGMTSRAAPVPTVEDKRRVVHSSPEVRHPPLPRTNESNRRGPWRTRLRGRSSVRRDAGRTAPRSVPAGRPAPPPGGDGHGPSPGGPARSRLRRLGRGGHTGVVRGCDAGALSGAPDPVERTGSGTSGPFQPRGDGGAADGSKRRCPIGWGADRTTPFAPTGVGPRERLRQRRSPRPSRRPGAPGGARYWD